MNIIYENNVIVDAQTSNAALQSKLTHDERMAMFGCDLPNQVVWSAMEDLERHVNDDVAVPVNLMVSEGLITQQRADEILAA